MVRRIWIKMPRKTKKGTAKVLKAKSKIAKRVKDTRTKRAISQDQKLKAKRKLPATEENIKKWKKAPGSSDLIGWDTFKARVETVKKKRPKTKLKGKKFKTIKGKTGLTGVEENSLIQYASQYVKDVQQVDFMALIDPTLNYQENKEIIQQAVNPTFKDMAGQFELRIKKKPANTTKKTAPSKTTSKGGSKGFIDKYGLPLVAAGAIIAGAYFLTRGGEGAYYGTPQAGSVPGYYPGGAGDGTGGSGGDGGSSNSKEASEEDSFIGYTEEEVKKMFDKAEKVNKAKQTWNEPTPLTTVLKAVPFGLGQQLNLIYSLTLPKATYEKISSMPNVSKEKDRQFSSASLFFTWHKIFHGLVI